MRISLVEAMHPRNQPSAGKNRRTVDAHQVSVAVIEEPTRVPVGEIERMCNRAEIFGALLSQFKPAGVVAKQTMSEPLLKCLDLPTHCAVCTAKFTRSLYRGAQSGRRFERTQPIQ